MKFRSLAMLRIRRPRDDGLLCFRAPHSELRFFTMNVKEVCPDPLDLSAVVCPFLVVALAIALATLGRWRSEPFQHCHGRLRLCNLCRQCMCNLLPRLCCLCASLSDLCKSFLSNHSSTVTVNRAFFLTRSSVPKPPACSRRRNCPRPHPANCTSMDRRCPVTLVPRDLFRNGCPWSNPQAPLSAVDQKTSSATMKRVFCVLMRSQSVKFPHTALSHWVMKSVTSIGLAFNPSKEFGINFPLILGFVKKLHRYLDEVQVYDSIQVRLNNKDCVSHQTLEPTLRSI